MNVSGDSTGGVCTKRALGLRLNRERRALGGALPDRDRSLFSGDTAGCSHESAATICPRRLGARWVNAERLRWWDSTIEGLRNRRTEDSRMEDGSRMNVSGDSIGGVCVLSKKTKRALDWRLSR